MTGSYILAAILLFLLILLLAPVEMRLSIGKETAFRLQYFFITFLRFPAREKKEKQPKEQPEDTQQSKKESKSFFATLKRFKEQTGYDTIADLINLIRDILLRFQRLLKHVVLKKTELELIVAGEDAATTAIQYGSLCAAVYPVATLLSECIRFYPESIVVRPDFEKTKTEFTLDTDASIRVIYLLIFAVSTAFYLLKLKMGEKKNERK